jgi:hypothetical protein
VPTATLGDVMRDKLAALTGKTAEDSGEKQGQGKKKGKGAPAAETEDGGEDDES